MTSVSKGLAAEEAAAAFLVKKGYKILARRFRWAHGEIDIVAQKDNRIAFVEVRALTATDLRNPEATVSPAKQSRIARTAAVWLSRAGEPDCPTRFDVIAVSIPRDPATKPVIDHFEGAFLAYGGL